MSESKRICTRIINKHAPKATWDAADCTFVPEVGELIIYEPSEAGAPARIKIGDGSTYENGEKKVVKDLPFVDHDYSGDISELNKALSDHEKDTTAHVTATERTAWNDAKTHAASDHVALNHKHSGADITSGTVSIHRLPTISVAKGGTGATTAAAALVNLGLEATASELNVLKGITATTTELNYVDGVTSNIQTQLNGKAPSSHNHAAGNITSGTLSSNRLPTVPVSKGGTGATTAAQALVNLNALAKSGDTMTGRLQLNMSNPHIHMKDTGYSTDWYFQAYQDQLAFGPTFDTAVKTDKTGNMTVPGTITVENKVKLDYDSTNECLNFVFV